MIEADDYCSILAPTTITQSMIASTNVTPEDPNPAWSAATTYAVGDMVYLAPTHRVYQSAKAGNLNKDPSVPANQFDASGAITWWIDAGPTNLFAMFDGYASTQTTNPLSITVTLQPGFFNALTLLKIDAEHLSIVVKDAPGGNVIYSYDGDLEASQPADYYEYFFSPFQPQTRFNATDIPPYNNAELTITLTASSGIVALGLLAVGDLRQLGAPLRGASVEPQDYSYRSTDAFGNIVLKKRGYATNLRISAKMDILDANAVLDTVQNLLGTPVVVIGSMQVNYEALTAYGTISASLSYDDYNEPTLNLTILGIL